MAKKADDPMIETPYGKKRWSFLKRAMDSHEELITALKDLRERMRSAVGKFNVRKHYSLMVADAQAAKAIDKAEGLL